MGRKSQRQAGKKRDSDSAVVIPAEEFPSYCNSCCGHDCWWEPPSQSAPCQNECMSMEFCATSNIHGLKYIGQTHGHFLERLLWAIFFLAAVVASVYLIYWNMLKWLRSPVTVTFTEQPTDINDIPFPAVTICNVNNLRDSQVSDLYLNATKGADRGLSPEQIQEALNNVTYLQHVCDATSTSFSSKFNFALSAGGIAEGINRQLKDKYRATPGPGFDVVPFLQRHAQPCTDMIKLCLWKNQPLDSCAELFHEVITDYGKCCVFNMAPESLLSKYPRTTRTYADLAKKWSRGKFDIDSLIYKDDDDEDEDSTPKVTPEYPQRVRSSGLTNGMSIVLDPDIHEYACTAADSVGFQIALHLPIEFPQIAEFGDAIPHGTEAFLKVKPDMTLADDGIRGLAVEDRNCYFTGEFILAYFTKYTRRNCRDECYANITFKNCNCTRYYMPRDPDRQLCTHEQIKCTLDTDAHFQENPELLEEYCKLCRPTCNNINYVAEITSRPMRKDVNIWAHPLINTTNWERLDLSMIHVYFGEDRTYPKIRKRLLGVTDLLASIGSLLGLTVGFSALSFFEFLFYVFKKLIGWLLRVLRVNRWCDEDGCCCCCCGGESDSQGEDDEHEPDTPAHALARRRDSPGRHKMSIPLRPSLLTAPRPGGPARNQQHIAWNYYSRQLVVPRTDDYL